MSNTMHITLVALGTFLVGYGISGIVRRKLEVGIGGGATGGAKPLFAIKLVGIWSQIASITCVIGGAIILIPLIVALSTNQTTDTLQIQLTCIGGLLISAIGFLFCWIMQFATSFGGGIRNHRADQ